MSEEVGNEGRNGQVAPTFCRCRGLPASITLLSCHWKHTMPNKWRRNVVLNYPKKKHLGQRKTPEKNHYSLPASFHHLGRKGEVRGDRSVTIAGGSWFSEFPPWLISVEEQMASPQSPGSRHWGVWGTARKLGPHSGIRVKMAHRNGFLASIDCPLRVSENLSSILW